MSREIIERPPVIITIISLLLGFLGLFVGIYFGITSHNNSIAAQNDAAISTNRISKLQYQVKEGEKDREKLLKSNAELKVQQKRNTMDILYAFSENKKQTFQFFNQIFSNQQIADRKHDIFIEFTKTQQQTNLAIVESIDDIKADDMYLEPYNEELDFMVREVLQDNETTKEKMAEILDLLETQELTQEPVIATPKEPAQKPVRVISRQRVKRRIKAPPQEPVEVVTLKPNKEQQNQTTSPVNPIKSKPANDKNNDLDRIPDVPFIRLIKPM